MNKKNFNLLLVAIILVLSLPACNRALSTAPAPAPQQTLEGFKVQEQPGDAITQSATQTALASVGGGKAEVTLEAGAQPDAVEATKEPKPKEEKPVVLPTEGRPSTYVLQKGEWPICIARRFNLDIGTFFQANGLNMNSKPGVGTTLKIPQSGTWSETYGSRTLKAHGSSHMVQSGETVYSIACGYGDVNPDAIIAANHLKSPYTLTAGQTLTIP